MAKAKKPTKKAAKKPKPKANAARKPPKRDAGKEAPPGPATLAIERQVREMLDADAAGDIDNVFDIVEELMDYDQRLPKASALRPPWDKFFADCERIMIEVSR